MNDVTILLQAMDRGEGNAAEDLLPLVYGELRGLARAHMSREAGGHTLQATALVHEAWLRLAGSRHQGWENRAHFFGAAAEAMRRILIERARRRARWKHGGGQQRVEVDAVELAEATPDEKLLLIDEALRELEAESPERARVVVLKFFSGLSNKEAGEALGICERTVNRHWLCARTWLLWKLRGEF